MLFRSEGGGQEGAGAEEQSRHPDPGHVERPPRPQGHEGQGQGQEGQEGQRQEGQIEPVDFLPAVLKSSTPVTSTWSLQVFSFHILYLGDLFECYFLSLLFI